MDFNTASAQAEASGKLLVCFFWASFNAASMPNGQMDKVFQLLEKRYGVKSVFVKVDAEENEDLAEKFSVHVVPTFVFIRGASVLDRVTGANPKAVRAKLETLIASAKSKETTSEAVPEANNELNKLVNASHVVLFIHGTAASPDNKDGQTVVQLLQQYKFSFSTFDLNKDPKIISALKAKTDASSPPLLFVGGKFIGSTKAINRLHLSNKLADLKPKGMATAVIDPEAELNKRLGALIASSEVFMFMKGSPEAPRCGFSRKMVGILQEQKVEFSSFDILTDNEVRQGLKKYSNWPTYPQLYVKTKLVGGLDIVKEILEDEGDEEGGFRAGLGL